MEDGRSAIPRVPGHSLVKALHQGGRGDVWFACDIEGRYRAVKTFSRDRFENDHAYGWELHDLAKFESISTAHAGLIDILQVGESEANDYFYCIMELADDEQAGAPGFAVDAINPDSYQPRTLQGLIQQSGGLPLTACLNAGVSLAGALHHVHQQNLLLSDSHPTKIVFVGGVAKYTVVGRVTDSPNARFPEGSESFAPPEGTGTRQGDVYTLGKVLYEMATGQESRQFPAWPALGKAQNRSAWNDLKKIILKACAADLRDRYVTSEDLYADLVTVQKGRRVTRFVFRSPLVKVGLALVLIGLGASVFFWAKNRFSQEKETPIVVTTPPPVQPTSPPVVTPAPAAVPAPPPVATEKPLRFGKTLFSDQFDTDSSANWIIKRTSADTVVIFAYDYSEMGIPRAPGANGTRGLKLAANMELPKSRELVNLSPAGRRFEGDYRLKFLVWMNANGPFPDGGPGSTQYILAGAGTDGQRFHWTVDKKMPDDGIWFSSNGDGDVGSSSDFSAFRGGRSLDPASGVFAAGFGETARGNKNPYYAQTFPGGQTPPAAQTALHPSQVGGLLVGTIGMAWRTVEVIKVNREVRWIIDGLLMATVPIEDEPFSSNVFIGYGDITTSVADRPHLCFAVVENLVVEEILP